MEGHVSSSAPACLCGPGQVRKFCASLSGSQGQWHPSWQLRSLQKGASEGRQWCQVCGPEQSGGRQRSELLVRAPRGQGPAILKGMVWVPHVTPVTVQTPHQCLLTDRIIQRDWAGRWDTQLSAVAFSMSFGRLYVSLPPLQMDLPNLSRQEAISQLKLFFYCCYYYRKKALWEVRNTEDEKGCPWSNHPKKWWVFFARGGGVGGGFTSTYVNIVSVTLYMQFCFLFFPLVYWMYFSKWQHCFLHSCFYLWASRREKWPLICSSCYRGY